MPDRTPARLRGSDGTPRIAVVGSLMIDMISYLPRLPAAGETLIGGSFELGFGGKGANQAVMARRMGAQVSMVGCLGRDVFGDLTYRHLVDEGIDVAALQRVAGVSSGVAPIWVEPDGTNRIACIGGANEHLDADRAARALHEIRPHVVLAQFETSQEVTVEAFRVGRQLDAVTVLNPAPAARVDDTLLDLTDWLIPNETEFAQLAGMTTAAIDDHALLDTSARIPARLVVTLGAAGAAYVADALVHRVPAPETTVVDTTGAGDAFVGAFAVAIASGMPTGDAVDLATGIASRTVGRRGTQSSFPSADECADLVGVLHAADPESPGAASAL